MINTCKILRVMAIRTYWAEQLIFWSKMGISAQYVRIVRVGHSYVLGSNKRVHAWFIINVKENRNEAKRFNGSQLAKMEKSIPDMSLT